MSKSELQDVGGDGAIVLASDFVDDGEILVGKLTSTLLGSVWVTWASGWILVANAITTVALAPIDALARYYVRILNALGTETASTSEVVWAEAFRSAVEVSPIAAPLLLTAEVAILILIGAAARRRWGL